MAVRGLGTDLCDARRIAALLERFGDRFARKCFTAGERAVCDARSGRAECYAKRFAAKEAVAKALADETSGALSWHSVEVVNAPSGRPGVRLYGEAAARLPEGGRVWLSLSDEPPLCLAVAVVEV